ncbi:hypothetical protein K8R03_04715 [Candidatus Kaiserbacteria bacterium]|nr:hypothetical protein [Candidatus Kaiserbacteria bacterium]
MKERLRPKQKTEKLPEKAAGISQQGDSWLASVDGQHSVPVPAALAGNIALALRVQEKVDDALVAGHRPGFLSALRMLNCRKTISAVTGAVPLRKLVSKVKVEGNLTNAAVEEASGIRELRHDIERLLESGRLPVLGTKDHMGIEDYLDESMPAEPAIVHVFKIPPALVGSFMAKLVQTPEALTAEECMTKLSRSHTFLVLGKADDGKYLCFQKAGPKIHQPFELRTLDKVEEISIQPESDEVYLSYIGPLESPKEE